MNVEQTDIVVIGMGPSGEYAAGKLAEAGLHATGVEARLVSGECPYRGCVPSKMMIRAASPLAEARRVRGMAGASTVAADWAPVAARIRDEATDTRNDKVAADRLLGKGGHFVRGCGRITGRREVTVESAYGLQVLRARRGIVIATGGPTGRGARPGPSRRPANYHARLPNLPPRHRRRAAQPCGRSLMGATRTAFGGRARIPEWS